MAIRLADAIVYFKGDSRQLDRDQKKSERGTRSWVNRVSNVITAGIAGGAALAGSAISGALIGAGKLALDAMPIEGISKSFYSMADAAKLAEMRVGSLNTVTDADLMKSYNSAALLVSESFANDLPDAMSYFGKISAATGEDIGFLMDSYITGVGRLSPMILDNLKIQVSAKEANLAYAASIGVTVDELTKEQQQIAMSEMVLQKLAERTAEMPDIADNAATKMAQLRAQLGNIADGVGTALLPVLTKLLEPIAQLVEAHGPALVTVVEQLTQRLMPVVDAVAMFLSQILSGTDPLTAFKLLLLQLVPPEIYAAIMETVSGVRAFLAEIWPTVEMVMAWISENIELQDVLIALGAFLAATLIPTLGTLIGTFVSIAAPILAVIAVVAALRQAWETDFLGIRTSLTQFWNDSVQPALVQLEQWLAVNIPVAIQRLSEFWTGTLQPAIAQTWDWIVANIFPIIEALVAQILAIPETIEVWKSNWEQFQMIISLAWQNIQEAVRAGVDAIVNFWSVGNSSIWQDISTIWSAIRDFIAMILDATFGKWVVALDLFLTALVEWWDIFGEYWRQLWSGVKEITSQAFDTIRSIFTNSLGAFVSIVSSGLETIYQIFSNKLQQVRLFINAIASGLRGDWDQFFDSLGQIAKLGGENLRLLIRGAFENIKTVVRTAWENIVTLVQDSIETIKTAFTVIDWGAVGRGIINGISNGISNGASVIADAARGAAQSALDAAKSLLGIQSPSKAFEAIGLQSTEGLEVGFRKGGDDAAAAAAMAVRRSVDSSREVIHNDNRQWHFSVRGNYREQDEVTMADEMRLLALQFGAA